MNEIYSNITAEELRRIIGIKDITLLDIRLKEDYDKGKIEGAINIFFGDYDFSEQLDELPKDKSIIVYCKVGSGSLKAIGVVEDLEFEKIYNLIGGIDQWRGKGYEIK